MKLRNLITVFTVIALCLFQCPVFAAQEKASTDTGYVGADQWICDSDGDLVPASDSSQDIGASGNEVDVIYADEIYLGGTSKTEWGSVVSPMTDASGYVYPTDSGGDVKLYDTGYIGLGGNAAQDCYVLFDSDDDDFYAGRDDTDNDFHIGVGSTVGTDSRIQIDDDTNNTIITIGDNTNGYDHYVIFDGNAVDYSLGYLDTYDMLIGSYGSTPDSNMCFGVENSTSPLFVLWNGIDGYGAVDIDYGSADITDHTFVSDGGTLIIDGTITLTDSEVISNATDDTVRIASNDSATVLEIYTPGTSNEDATLLLTADADADAGDRMAISHDGATNSMLFQSDTASADTLATILTLAKTGIITTTAAINANTEDSATNTVSDIVNIKHSTSDTAAAGFGAGLTFDIENASGTEEEHASIDVVATTATNGSEDTDVVVSQMTAGAVAETLRLVAASSATTSDYLQFTANTTETDAVTDVFVLKTATGTAAANSGMGISFQPEDATGSEEKASIDIVLTDATRATCDTDIVFKQDVAGTITETMRLDADAGLDISLGGADIILPGDEYLSNDTDDTLRVGSNDSSMILEVYSPNTSDGDASLVLKGDAYADAGDTWQILNDSSAQELLIGNDSSVKGTFATKAKIDANGDITFRTNLLSIGRVSASSSLASSSTSVGTTSVPYAYIRKFLGAGAEATTLPNGTPGQTLTLVVVVSAGGVWTITPSTSLLMSSWTMTAEDDSITLLYQDDVIGWIPVSSMGSTSINYVQTE